MIYRYGPNKDKMDGIIEIDRLDFHKPPKLTLASDDSSRGFYAIRAIGKMGKYHRRNDFPEEDMFASGFQNTYF
ncbi:hypothetical protein [Bacillus sp. JJ722]|uniref:hypothetical protein n=1 Tax=Bacillus sp. JJ722 TaxID=3122973 RepID=UPI0030008E33